MQPSVNKVILLGTIGEKIEFRHLENGGALCRFSVATYDYFTDKVSSEKKTVTDWHSVTSWGGTSKRNLQTTKKRATNLFRSQIKNAHLAI